MRGKEEEGEAEGRPWTLAAPGLPSCLLKTGPLRLGMEPEGPLGQLKVSRPVGTEGLLFGGCELALCLKGGHGRQLTPRHPLLTWPGRGSVS